MSDYKLIPKSEQVVIVEQIANAISGTMSDSLSLSEAIGKLAITLGLVDNPTFSEEVIKTVMTGRADVLDIAEDIAIAFGLLKNDSINISVSEKNRVIKAITDSIVLADSEVEEYYEVEQWWSKIKFASCCHGGL